MKEIDFLPEWYKSGRRRSVTYRTQYVVLGGIFAIMMVWNFFAAGSVSRAEAELSRISAGDAESQAATLAFTRLKDQISEVQKKAALIDDIDAKIDVASVLGEMSFLVDGGIVLSDVELIAERFDNTEGSKQAQRSGSLVRAARAKSNENETLPVGRVRFKVVIHGMAAKPGDVAALICKLEDSQYFFQVAPRFSRPVQIKPKTSQALRSSDVESNENQLAADIKASEFEISCYLANYRQQ